MIKIMEDVDKLPVLEISYRKYDRQYLVWNSVPTVMTENPKFCHIDWQIVHVASERKLAEDFIKNNMGKFLNKPS